MCLGDRQVGCGNSDRISITVVIALVALRNNIVWIHRARAAATRVGVRSDRARCRGEGHVERAAGSNDNRAGCGTRQRVAGDAATDIADIGNVGSTPGTRRAVGKIAAIIQFVGQDRLTVSEARGCTGGTVGDMQLPCPIVAGGRRAADVIRFGHRKVWRGDGHAVAAGVVAVIGFRNIIVGINRTGATGAGVGIRRRGSRCGGEAYGEGTT